MWERVRTAVGVMLMLVALCTAVVVVWWLLAPGRPMLVQRTTLRTPHVRAGADLVYEMWYAKRLPLPARVIRTLENDELIYLPIEETNLPVGADRIVSRVRVPVGITPGEYVLRVTMQYRRNPLVLQDVMFTVGPFEVE